MMENAVLLCWKCGKEHTNVPFLFGPVFCDDIYCGGTVVSNSGKVMGYIPENDEQNRPKLNE